MAAMDAACFLEKHTGAVAGEVSGMGAFEGTTYVRLPEDREKDSGNRLNPF
jgi:hypothetical protein